jgi:hypothetical protein
MSPRIAALPVDARGYPVPWFVDYLNGEPEFRAMDPKKWRRAVKEGLCWVCGQRLGAHLAFVLGPMCAITRTTAEPPCHLECAQWSAINCPFLARPKAKRREDEIMHPGCPVAGGFAIRRNPGVAVVWVTRSYETWRPAKGEILLRVGDPVRVEWYAEGRAATRAEVDESVRTGMPLLEEAARKEGEAGLQALAEEVAKADYLWPAN